MFEGSDRTPEKPPSYQESLTAPSGASLIQQTTGARSQRVHHVIAGLIVPVLSNRAAKGLSKTTIALIPKGDSYGSGDTKENTRQSLGLLQSAEAIEEILLEEMIDTKEFWTQKETMVDLCNILRDSLSVSEASDGHMALPERPEIRVSRFSFRKKSSGPSSATAAPRVVVAVNEEDMAYRIENDFGIYETLTKPAIVIRVDTRG